MATRKRGRTRRRMRRRNKSMKGGGGAADYVSGKFGGIGQQHTGQNGAIKTLQGGGKRRRSMKGGKKSKKGGFLGLAPIINQALVPFTILGMQKMFRK